VPFQESLEQRTDVFVVVNDKDGLHFGEKFPNDQYLFYRNFRAQVIYFNNETSCPDRCKTENFGTSSAVIMQEHSSEVLHMATGTQYVKELYSFRVQHGVGALRTRGISERASLGATALLVGLLLTGCSRNVKPHDAANSVATPSNPSDPSERTNRKIFAFNQAVDKGVVRPVARGYAHLPRPIKNGVHNFVQNLGEPQVFINDVLQANFRRSLNTGGRFVINSTVGVVGIFDVANHIGMPHHNADLGQTFGVWGMGTGRDLELPILGASNVRDTFGKVLGFPLNPLAASNSSTATTLNTAKSVGGIVDGRASALPVTDRLERSDDYYAALRDLNAERRIRFVAEGKAGTIRTSRHDAAGLSASGMQVDP
jgi:phospholipid-binding lipoprotein MlaA